MSNTTQAVPSEMDAVSSTPHHTKKMGLMTMLAICVGLVIVQGAMISAIQGVGIGGMAFVAAMIAALVIAQCNAMSFAELALMFPQSGTLATYTQKALGHFPAIIAVFAGYVAVAALAAPIEMFLIDILLGELTQGAVPEKVIPLIILVGLAFTNLVGADVFARVQTTVVVILVGMLALIGIVAITGIAQPHPELTGDTVDWNFGGVLDGSFVGLIALALWTMVGAEYICPLINDVKDPKKTIPRAMHLSLFIIFFLFMAFIYGASFYLNVETLTTADIPYVDYINAVFGKAGLLIATVIAITATCSTINTLLAAIPRMLQGMAEEGQVPAFFKKTNRSDVPWIGTVLLAGAMAVPYLSLSIDSLIVLVIAATTSYLIAYIIANVNVIVLRKRMPNHARPYRTPFYPVPQIIAIVAMAYVALNNSPSPEMTQTVYSITGGILLVVGLLAAFWVKVFMKRGLFEPDMTD